MGCGSGVTCGWRLREWHQAGVWEALHREILDEFGERNLSVHKMAEAERLTLGR